MRKVESTDRAASLARLAPDLFDYTSVLYIGARSNRFHFGKDFAKKDYEITVMEAYKPNVEALLGVPFVQEVIEADVRQVHELTLKSFDVIFWWHGPEHVTHDELLRTIPHLENLCIKILVLGCPWRKYAQGAVGGNPFERHLEDYDYDVFESLGFEVECLGERDKGGSNITSVKRMG